MGAQPTIRFGVIGINHDHIYFQVRTMLQAGAELAAFYASEPDLIARFQQRFPGARLARSREEILDDPSLHLIVSAAIFNQRAELGIAAMERGKDYMCDKPGFTTLAQLARVRQVQAATGRIYSVCYSERFGNPATLKAGELVQAGTIGQVIQTVGLGPHRTKINERAPWFFDREQTGGILCDIGSHQIDQFLYFTGSTTAEVVSAHVGNYHYPQYPGLDDFGEALLRGDGGTGYIRLDWLTPDGLDTWGDGRLTILGTEGYIELRKYIDIAGRPNGNHLFLVTQQSTRYIDCQNVPITYGQQLVADIINRTETTMSQAHCFLASELALKAQVQAVKLGHLAAAPDGA